MPPIFVFSRWDPQTPVLSLTHTHTQTSSSLYLLCTVSFQSAFHREDEDAQVRQYRR
jgi:hypothetical protein